MTNHPVTATLVASQDGLSFCCGGATLQTKKSARAFYEIRVEGTLGDIWLDWFEGLKICQETSSENGLPTTVIYGAFADQPALHGALVKIRDLNLTLISVKRITPGKETV